MFIDREPADRRQYYGRMLSTLGSLSRLFSESADPYMQSRVAENLFCRAFGAENLSRSDCSVDARKGAQGIGVKTFLEGSGSTFQKVAEFNGDHHLFSKLDSKMKIRKVAELRNERLEVTKRMYGLKELIYHCITRKGGVMSVYEMPMPFINIKKIKLLKQGRGTISFTDGADEYSFSISKSTLSKKFHTRKALLTARVSVVEDPFAELERVFGPAAPALAFAPVRTGAEKVFLPLYSEKAGEKYVHESSGLNQWNASGRKRHKDEMYIRVPSWVHQSFPKFFPPRDKPFSLKLPDGTVLSAKLCQQGSKALMSNPNAALGQWFLRYVLQMPDGALVTYAKLEELGLDSAVIYKNGKGSYEIDFAEIGSFDSFEEENRKKQARPR